MLEMTYRWSLMAGVHALNNDMTQLTALSSEDISIEVIIPPQLLLYRKRAMSADVSI